MIRLSLSSSEDLRRASTPLKQSGFSLIEMAVVMVILGFILGGVMGPLSSQREVQKRKEAQQQLQEIRDALLGFAQMNNSNNLGLPCPATSTSQGRSVSLGGNCTAPTADSLVPYAEIGIRGVIQGGVLRDAWQQPVIYRLTAVNTWAYAKPINLTGNTPANFRVCTDPACAAAHILATGVVAVVFTTGEDTVSSNTTAANDFISNPIPPSTAFDDQMLWISQPELIYAISKAR